MTSGAIQKGVPMTVPRRDMVDAICAATPKSASLMMPLSERSRLPACVTKPAEC